MCKIGGERVTAEQRITLETKLKKIAEEMMQIAVNSKISCSQMEMVMFYLESKVKHRAGEKEF